MRISSFFYTIKQGIKNIFRNAVFSLASIATIASCLLLFALLFWFLCPVPKNTLFWIAGSTTYLWANTFSFLFLFLFQKYKDENFGPKEKLGLFLLSFLAASEYITAAAISGALVVYYALLLV